MQRLNAAVIALLLPACGIEQGIKGLGGSIADVTYCEVEPCGRVFLCDLSDYYRLAPPNLHTTTPELCWIDDDGSELEAALGEHFADVSCMPTPRGGADGWPCLYGCEPGHKWSNAYQGSYCD